MKWAMPCFNIKTVFPGMGIAMIKIRQSSYHYREDSYIGKMVFFTRSPVCCDAHQHYSAVIMSATTSQITGVSNFCSTVCYGADQIKHQSSVSLAFVRGIHRPPVDSTHKEPVRRKMFPFDDAIMTHTLCVCFVVCAGSVTVITGLVIPRHQYSLQSLQGNDRYQSEIEFG